MKVSVWAREVFREGIEIITDKEHYEWLEKDIEAKINDSEYFAYWLNDNYTASEIWDLAESKGKTIWEYWREYCVNKANEQQEWENFILEV